MKEKIKRFYPRPYSKSMVKVFVTKGKLTPEEYEEITGEAYGDDD